jgi:hypothetical protein
LHNFFVCFSGDKWEKIFKNKKIHCPNAPGEKNIPPPPPRCRYYLVKGLTNHDLFGNTLRAFLVGGGGMCYLETWGVSFSIKKANLRWRCSLAWLLLIYKRNTNISKNKIKLN